MIIHFCDICKKEISLMPLVTYSINIQGSNVGCDLTSFDEVCPTCRNRILDHIDELKKGGESK